MIKFISHDLSAGSGNVLVPNTAQNIIPMMTQSTAAYMRLTGLGELNTDSVIVGTYQIWRPTHSRVTLYTTGPLYTAVPLCSHSRGPIVDTAVPRENNEHGCVY